MATNNSLNNRSAPFTVVAGDLSVTTNNFNLPDTTSSASGVITVGLQPFIHAYNGVVNANTFVGAFAGNFTNTGSNNTGIGAQVLDSLTSGANNTVVGSFSGSNITSGQFNTIVGSGSGSMSTGGANTVIGYNAGITGDYNHSTYVGFGAGFGAQSDNNVAIGSETLPISNAGSNTVVGRAACFQTTGQGNVALGFQAMSDAIDANFNVAVGRFALQNVDFGAQRNVALGLSALQALKGGNWNVACGADSGSAYVAGESSNIVIGYGVTGTAAESNVLRIGAGTGAGAGQLNTAFIHGINGNTVANTQIVTIDSSTSQLGTTALSPSSLFPWSEITTSQTAAVNNGYFINSVGSINLALPAVSAVGDVIEVCVISAGSTVVITQAAGQRIFFGTTNTTLGATGTLTSNNPGDSVKLVCRTANTVWYVVSSIGTWTEA